MAQKIDIVLPSSLATKAKAATVASGFEKDQEIPKSNILLQSQTVRTLRNRGLISEAVRKLARVDGTVSTAVFAFVQIANSGYKLEAHDSSTHEYSPEGTRLAKSVVAAMDVIYDYSEKFSDKRSFGAIIESALREVVLTGGVAGELILDKQRLPANLNLIPYEQLTWKSKGSGHAYPRQQPTTGDAVDLNIPTFWVAESHKEANVAYATSMMESAVETAFYFMEFVEDMRRSVRRSGHTRLLVKILAEKVQASAPPETQSDPDKLLQYMESIKNDVVSVINSLEPEDALIAYDSLEVDSVKADSEKADYKELLTAISGLLATSLKSHPSILGLRMDGSQSLSNTESLVFLKMARAIQLPVEELLSRALTLAVRLFGSDVFIKFSFKSIDFRPEAELEAFRTMHQSRILEQLSLGMISDEKAAADLGLGELPPGAPKLSGTMFQMANTTRAAEVSPNADPMGSALQPNTPSKAGGRSQ